MLVSGEEEGSGGRRHRRPGTPRSRREWGWGRDQAPTPGRGDEGSMGAKESRIGFLSYEEALRRGEGGGVRTSRREGQPRAARRVGERPGGGAGGCGSPEAGGEGARDGRVWGRGVGWERGWGVGTAWEGEAPPEGGVPGARRAGPCSRGSWFSWMGQGSPPLPSPSEGTSPLSPLVSLCHFLIALLPPNAQQHPNLAPNSLAWKRGGEREGEGERRRLHSPPLWAGRSPCLLWSLCLFRGPWPVSWGLSPSPPSGRLTRPRAT